MRLRTASKRIARGERLTISRLAGVAHIPVLTAPFATARKTTAAAAAQPAAPEARGGARAAQYERKDPREHVLLRPGMYVGATTPQPVPPGTWIPEASGGATLAPAPPGSVWVPALVKVFDEVLVNAMDNRTRDGGMTRLSVELHFPAPGAGVGSSATAPVVVVTNNGRGLPVALHPTEGVWVPELVMGHLLTGSNFGQGGDSAAAATGGRHGYGAKLANIMSTTFSVTTYDSTAPGDGRAGASRGGALYRQVWTDNMGGCATHGDQGEGGGGHMGIRAIDDENPWHRIRDAGSFASAVHCRTGVSQAPVSHPPIAHPFSPARMRHTVHAHPQSSR
jgi:hypothetical protein